MLFTVDKKSVRLKIILGAERHKFRRPNDHIVRHCPNDPRHGSDIATLTGLFKVNVFFRHFTEEPFLTSVCFLG